MYHNNDGDIMIAVDIDDPFTSILAVFKNNEQCMGYSKRTPNDVPNDRIAIQVAVARLIKRIKNGN